MKTLNFTLLITALSLGIALAAEEKNPIEKSMAYSHKAPKGQKKVSDKIIDGTASDDEVKKTLELYKAAAETKPPKGDQAEFKQKFAKLIAATEDVAAKKPNAAAGYKAAVNCKACHSEHKGD